MTSFIFLPAWSVFVHECPVLHISGFKQMKVGAVSKKIGTVGSRAEDAGKLVLRVTIAGLMLFHGFAKLKNGVAPIEGMLTANGLPTFFAYGVYIGEVVVPFLMIIGCLTRVSALVFAFDMLVAILLAHSGDVVALGPYGGWKIELQMLYLLGAVAVTLVGPGRYSLPPRDGVWA